MSEKYTGLKVVDTDHYFVIDAFTREITSKNPQKDMLIQNDHNSERFTFEIPRFIEGRDVGKCNVVQVCYLNGKSSGVYTVDDLNVYPFVNDILTCSWLVSQGATGNVGPLRFMLRFAQVNDDASLEYAWSTKIYEKVQVVESLDRAMDFEREYVDVIEQWKNTVMGEMSAYVETTVATQVDVAQITANRQGIAELNTEAATLKARMDTFTKLGEGSTTGDAELMDMRVDANGVTYPTAGDAIRARDAEKPDRHEAVMKKTGKNLFNKDTVTYGAFLNGSPYPAENDSSFYSDYIPVKANTTYAINQTEAGGRYICFYDTTRTLVPGGFPMQDLVNAGVNTFATPADTAFLRISAYADMVPTLQLEEGSEVTHYEPYYEYEPLHALECRMTDIDRSKVTANPSKNLFNKDTITPGYYLIGSGTFVASETAFVSDFIPVTGGQTYSINNNTGGGRYICFFGATDAENALEGFRMSILYNAGINHFTAPAFATSMRISHFLSAADRLQIEVGDTVTDYEPYYEHQPIHSLEQRVDNIEDMLTLRDKVDYSQLAGVLTVGTMLTMSTFPSHIKNDQCITFSGQFTSFGYLRIGKGYESYRGAWFEITPETITLYTYENEANVGTSVSHGLTISSYIDVIIDSTGNAVTVSINTLSGGFQHTFIWNYNGNGSPFVQSGKDMYDCFFNATSSRFNADIWMFGDSYFGMNNSRVMGQLKNLGYGEACLINGLAGLGSSGAYADLLKCLEMGSPKIIVWCLGMNDSNESYKSYLDKLCQLCEDRGIALILAKIPTVPERDKETINQYVTATGLRYVDFYKAVGTDSTGTWYDGYLDTDKVHPTELGARALASRLVMDVPELTRYR